MQSRFCLPSNLSQIAFGVSGPHATALVPDHVSQKLIHEAFEGGITAFDTGPSYGAGAAEERLGRAIKTLDRSKVFISTKAGILENKSRDFSAESISRSLDRSLARLQCDYVDVLFMHGPGRAELNDELAEVLRAEKKSGRIRSIGIAGRGQEIEAALSLGVFDLLLAPVHAGLSNKEIHRLKVARKAGLGVVGIEVLTGASAGLRWPRSTADLWYCARALRRRKLSAPKIPAMDAMRSALNNGLADVIMVSTTRQAHLQDALRVLDETGPST